MYPDAHTRLLFYVELFAMGTSRMGPLRGGRILPNHNFRSMVVSEEIKTFFDHSREMIKEGVKPVIKKYRYSCTNKSDKRLVTGWLEMLVILRKIVPDVSQRQKPSTGSTRLNLAQCKIYH